MNKELKTIKTDADTAVLFIHGILGTPRHFDFLMPIVPETWSVWSILLPGHGGSCSDFANSSMTQWKAYCERAFLELYAGHSHVILAGHSMGTLLSVYLARKYPERVQGIFALGMPLHVHFTPAAMLGCMYTSFGSGKSNNPYLRSFREAGSVKLSKNPFAYLRWIPRYLELFELCRETRAIMPQLQTPCIAIQSGKDELVSFRSIKCTGTAETIVLPDSRHFFYSERDRETIIRRFDSFVHNIDTGYSG